MAHNTLTATTPYGTFTRRTTTAYTHVAVFTNPDGSPMRLVGMAGIAARGRGEQGPAYMAKWSRSAAGAMKLQADYNPKAVLVGIYKVDSDEVVAPPAPVLPLGHEWTFWSAPSMVGRCKVCGRKEAAHKAAA